MELDGVEDVMAWPTAASDPQQLATGDEGSPFEIERRFLIEEITRVHAPPFIFHLELRLNLTCVCVCMLHDL
jgi:hypothetical protein